MYKSGRLLCTCADFDNAILFGLLIQVWQNGRLIDGGGEIHAFTQSSVTVHSIEYLRNTTEFRVC